MGYIGNEPTTGHFPVDNFTSSGGSTYTLTRVPASAGAIEVSVQGVLQPTTAYTVSGTTLNMAGVTTGVKIFVRHLGETLSLPTPADGSVTTTKLGTNSVDGTKIAMGSDARGDILYHGATDYARLAKGTSGQILTMGANDPAWADAGGGLHTQIGSTSDVTNVASIEWTSGISGYKTYIIIGEEITGHSSDAHLRLVVGESGGYKTDANYSYHHNTSKSSSASYAAFASGGSAYIKMDDGITYNANSTYNFTMRLYYMSGRRFSCAWDGTHYNGGTGHTEGGPSTGAYLQAVTFDRFKIYTGGGNFTGRFRLFGI